MNFCSNCGTSISENARFCPNCGMKIEYPHNQNSQRNTIFEGTIHKCPNCGDILPAFVMVCPSCNYELRDGSTAESLNKLEKRINDAKTEPEKIQCVKTFPVPNTKEDIYEFMILAASNFDEHYYVTHKNEDDIADAWLVKIEQCYQKSRLIFTVPEELNVITEIYNKVQQRIIIAKKTVLVKQALPYGLIAIGLILIITQIQFLSNVGVVILIVGILLLCKKRGNQKLLSEQKEISNNDIPSTGFSSWSVGGKILWIVLNIYTLGIPAIIYARRKN